MNDQRRKERKQRIHTVGMVIALMLGPFSVVVLPFLVAYDAVMDWLDAALIALGVR